jgi:DNA transformation protein
MNEIADRLKDVFWLFGPVEVRRMFGGHGIFRDGLMFGLMSKQRLYLKTDAENVSHFTQRDLPPFEYLRQGSSTKLSYYLAPDEVMDDCVEAAIWARRSFEAALRGREFSGSRKPKRKNKIPR